MGEGRNDAGEFVVDRVIISAGQTVPDGTGFGGSRNVVTKEIPIAAADVTRQVDQPAMLIVVFARRNGGRTSPGIRSQAIKRKPAAPACTQR